MDTFTLVLIFVVAAVISYRVADYFSQKAHDELMQAMIEAKIDELQNILVRCEKHGDQFYFWRSENDEFLCQGKTMSEVQDAFEKRFGYNGAKLLVVDSDPETLAGLK